MWGQTKRKERGNKDRIYDKREKRIKKSGKEEWKREARIKVK
jgi:hypothetical protein